VSWRGKIDERLLFPFFLISSDISRCTAAFYDPKF
jgi:hypothetical protein